MDVTTARFPWEASSRALTLGRPQGLIKLVLANAMGATAHDLALSIHAHPTLSETVMEAGDLFMGNATHLYRRKRAR